MLEFENIIELGLHEDLGLGDITTESCVPADAKSSGSFIAKEDGIICGLEIAAGVFRYLDSGVKMDFCVSDGDFVERGNIVATIAGPSRAILSGERLALNLLQRLSGIATVTRRASGEIAGFKTRITDTRKTTPGLRTFEKYAVRTGGGSNHRFGLFDGILIKDNHIKAAGGIREAVLMARERAPHTMRVEVETETLEQVSEALDAGADIIMLDNMATELMAEAVKLIDGRALTEASGNMDRRSLREVAETGVDFISIGALTHSVKAMDISLKFI